MSIFTLFFANGSIWFGIIDLLVIITALIVVPRNRRPSAATAWLMLIVLAPLPGFLVFLVLGRRHLPRERRKRHNEIVSTLHRVVEEYELHSFPVPHESRSIGFQNAVDIGRQLGAFPMLGGNRVRLYPEYHESIAQLAAAIDTATEYVHLEFYILVYDSTTEPVFSALERAVQRGVTVRVLLDYVSAVRNPGMARTRKRLKRIGAQWRYMLPLRVWRLEYQRPDLRNHRKLAVIDGRVGFMGSQNLVDSSYNKLINRRRNLHWKDLMVRIEGPAVLSLEAIFMADWYAETGIFLDTLQNTTAQIVTDSGLEMQLLPSGPGYDTENNLQVFVALFYAAQQRISITSPYFIPDGALMQAIKAARARGVAVELFVSEVGDQPVVYHAQRSYYEELLSVGVKIYMYRPPFILHAKHFSIDDDIVVLGSSNMDQRSFNLNYEISMVVHSRAFAREMDGVITDYRAASRELTAQEWSRQGVFARLLDNLARLTSSLQ